MVTLHGTENIMSFDPTFSDYEGPLKLATARALAQ